MLKNLIFALFSFYVVCLSGLSCNPKYITKSDKYHIVQKGETLELIASKYNISSEKIKLYNNIDDSKLLIGQKIYLHPADSNKQEYVTVRSIPDCKYHIVQKNETLTRIAKMYDIFLFDLLEFNGLTSFDIQPKQKIWLEEGHLQISEVEGNKKPTEKTVNAEKALVHKPKEKQEEMISAKSGKLKFILPTTGKVSSEFGMRLGRPHKGIDIAAPTGTPIYAVEKGDVIFSGRQQGYGNVIMIQHDKETITVYAHNEINLVREGDSVKQGQPIGKVGNTGRSSGSHLHFEIRLKTKAQNPRNFLPNF